MNINEEDFERITSHELAIMMNDSEFDGEQKIMILLIGSLVIRRIHKAIFNHDDSEKIEIDNKEI